MRDAWRGLKRVWVVPSVAPVATTACLTGESVVAAYGPTVRNLGALLRNFVLAWRLIGDIRPRVIVASGAVGVHSRGPVVCAASRSSGSSAPAELGSRSATDLLLP